MKKFSLISEYNNIIKETPIQNSNKIKYQEYILEVDSKECSVYIPLRECDNFEYSMNHLSSIKENDLIKLMREFRGIRNKDK
jgi:hypothetical protein